MKSVVRPVRPVAIVPKPVSAAPKMGGRYTSLSNLSKKKQETFTTATLLRGRTYFYGPVQFFKDVEKVIDVDLMKLHNLKQTPEDYAEELRDLFEDVVDSDEEAFSKPTFSIRTNRPRPLSEMEQARQNSPRRIRQFVPIDAEEQVDRPVRSRTVGLVRR